MSVFSSLFGSKDNSAIKDAVEEGAFLVDVRSPGEFSLGTAEGAVNIPLEALESQISQFEGKKNIILFCRSGARSGYAQSVLEQKGFENVFNGGTWQSVAQLIK